MGTAKRRRYADFTAQGINVQALMRLYGDLEKSTVPNPNLVPIVVFLAFSIESYLNSIGARKLAIWDEIERLPWRSKVEVLHKTAGAVPDWGVEPLQFATEVFRLRDRLAHGKPERVIEPIGTLHNDANGRVVLQPVQPEWYRSITKEWALSAKERFRVLMTYLGNLFGLHESDHLHLSTGGTIVDDNA